MNLKQFPRKFGNNTDINIKSNEDNKSNTDSKKATIHFDTIELNKNDISKRKEPSYEEENTPLITKDKFNEMLKIYKKK